MTYRCARLLPAAALIVLALALPASASANLSFECCSTSAESHSATTAALSASFNPRGTPTTVHFEYRPKGAAACGDGYDVTHPGSYSFPGATSTPDQALTGTGQQEFSADVSSLAGGQAYCATYFAQNADGSGYSQPNEFVAGAPTASADLHWEAIAPDTAVARGTINPAGQATNFGVRIWSGGFHGCGTPPLAEATATDSGDPGTHPFALNITSNSLARGTDYTTHAFASNASGSAACVAGGFLFGAPYAVIGSASNVGSSSATLTNQINPGGGPTNYTLGIDTAESQFCRTAFATPAIKVDGTVPGTGFSRQTVSDDVSGLAPGTDYCWGLRARNDVATGIDEHVVGHGAFRTTAAAGQQQPQNQQPGGGGSSVVLPTGLTGGSNAGTATADSKGNVTIPKLQASCGIGPCVYNSTATTPGSAKKLRAAAKKKKPKAVKVASGKLTLQTNTTGAIKLKLSSAGKKLLKKKKTLSVSVKVSGKDASGKAVTKTVKLKIKAAKKKR